MTGKRKFPDQPKLKLYYFDIKGKGEPIRLLAAYSGLELEDYRFEGRDHFMKLKEDGTLPFGQVPLLEVDGKDKLPQSAAILRYLSRIAGLYPEDPIQAARVDAALDAETDAMVGPSVVSYTTRFGIDLDDEMKEKAGKAIDSEVFPRHLGNLERLLASSKTGWVAGTAEPSPADFAWVCTLAHTLPSKDRIFSAPLRTLEAYPHCQGLVEKLMGLPAIKAYYAAEQATPPN